MALIRGESLYICVVLPFIIYTGILFQKGIYSVADYICWGETGFFWKAESMYTIEA